MQTEAQPRQVASTPVAAVAALVNTEIGEIRIILENVVHIDDVRRRLAEGETVLIALTGGT